MQIPRSYVENYSRALNVVSERARAALVDALSQLDYTADIADIRNAVITIMQPACGASATMAARLAADFYNGLRAQFGIDDGYMAQVDSQRVPEATTGAVRAFVQDLVDDKPIEQFVGKCADRIDYETRKAANECVEFNAKNDPKKPRWARIPTGVETCQFCIMLASRGFVYHSEETASHAHSSCDCRVVPSWDKSPTAQGYDPDLYYDMWKHPEKYENAQEQKQPAFEFMPAKDIKEAKQYAKSNFDCEADFTGLDIRAVNEMNKSIATHIDMFPELKDNFGFVGSAQACNTLRKSAWEDYYYNKNFDTYERLGKDEGFKRRQAKKAAARTVGKSHGEWAWSYSPEEWYPDSHLGGICMNKSMWAPKAFDQQIESLKYNVETEYHPIGCDTVKSIFDHEIGHQLDSLLSIRSDSEFIAYYGGLSRDEVKSGLSGYAVSNDAEFIAEAWSEYQNNPNPRAHAQFVGDLIMRKYKGGDWR